ncbi:MAG: hypothetical protein BWX99_00749 [Deltaproteobacteria bacterium ADurb.Bin151]|nr:MAG: hypothetical protein BWX99_00749 [Deltaproteobacteria bacterium ADurb.Bin151]
MMTKRKAQTFFIWNESVVVAKQIACKLSY